MHPDCCWPEWIPSHAHPTHLHSSCCGCPPVRHVKHAPAWQQLPHITKGYRVGFDSWRHVLASLFTLHNETVNIWSHLVGAGYVLWCLFAHVDGRAVLHEIDAAEHRALLVFLLSALACLTLSSFYHWWGCGSQRLFELLLRADFVGIALLIWGSYLPGIHYAFYCFEEWQWTYQMVIVAVGVLGIVGAAFTDVNCPKQSSFRTTTFALLVGFGLVPAAHWCFLVPVHVRGMFLDNLMAMFLSYGLGFTFWATRFPEVRFSVQCGGLVANLIHNQTSNSILQPHNASTTVRHPRSLRPGLLLPQPLAPLHPRGGAYVCMPRPQA